MRKYGIDKTITLGQHLRTITGLIRRIKLLNSSAVVTQAAAADQSGTFKSIKKPIEMFNLAPFPQITMTTTMRTLNGIRSWLVGGFQFRTRDT